MLSAVPRELARTMTAADLPALRSYLSEAQRWARPVHEDQAIRLLEGLFLHYPARALSVAESAVIWADWVEDLGELPEDVLSSACRMWRRSSERFAPSPGQLLAKVGGSKHWGLERRGYVRRASETLAILEAAEVQA